MSISTLLEQVNWEGIGFDLTPVKFIYQRKSKYNNKVLFYFIFEDNLADHYICILVKLEKNKFIISSACVYVSFSNSTVLLTH